jgi:hypothetical protein
VLPRPFPSSFRIGASSLHLFHRASHVLCEAMAAGVAPRLTDWASTGGAYFLNDVSGQGVAVIKPEDEEPYGACRRRRPAALSRVALPCPSLSAGEA